jgi:hypothetical protein
MLKGKENHRRQFTVSVHDAGSEIIYDEYDRKINGETRKAGNRVGVIF